MNTKEKKIDKMKKMSKNDGKIDFFIIYLYKNVKNELFYPKTNLISFLLIHQQLMLHLF